MKRRLRLPAPAVQLPLLTVVVLLAAATPAAALGQDTLTLGTLQRAAIERDARTRQLGLEEQATGLRLRNLRAERLPALSASGQATHQSEVARIPVSLPGADIPVPPKTRYDVTLAVEQLLYDGGALDARRAGEEAALAAELARIRASLYPLRSEVSDAWFEVLLLESRLAEIASLVEDLTARLDLLRTRVAEGAALPGDTATVRAELLRAWQSRSEADAGRRAALAVLSDLTGRTIRVDDVLALPSTDADVPSPEAATTSQSHPQYAVFEARRRQLELQSSLVAAGTRPYVSAFGQVSYGRPGLQQFTRELHDYWMAGVVVRWQPWRWGVTEREQTLLRIEQELVAAEADAFGEQLVRRTHGLVEEMNRLRAALDVDEQIVALREQVVEQATAQLAERVITPPDYVDARTDLQDARIELHRHRIELARARSRYLTLLGVTQ